MNTKQAKKAILELVDSEGGSMHARDKLIPHMARKLRKGEKCHETWPAIEHGLRTLADDGILRITFSGKTIRGVDRIDNDDDILEEAPAPILNTIELKDMTMTTENNQVEESAETVPEVAVAVSDESFVDLPRHKQVSLALLAFQHAADPETGEIIGVSSEQLLIDELKIPKKLASELNRILGKLGLRKTIGRLKKHLIDMTVDEVTAAMVASVSPSKPKPKSETVISSTPTDAASQEEASAEDKGVPDVSPSVVDAPIATLAQLEARFLAAFKQMEKEKDKANAALAEENARLSDELKDARKEVERLQKEQARVERDTRKLVERLTGERDQADQKLQLFRQAATKPMEFGEELTGYLTRYAPSTEPTEQDQPSN